MPRKKQEKSLTKKSNYFFIALYLISLVVLFLLFRPYFAFLALGGIIVIFLFPINIFVRKHIKNRITSSLIMTIGVLLLIFIPTAFLGYTITKEATSAYNLMINMDYSALSEKLTNIFGFQINFTDYVTPVINFFMGFLSKSIPSLLGSISEFAIKLMLMFFLIYYGFKEGDRMLEGFMNILPISQSHKSQISDEANKVLYGVLRGQILIALIQGALGGLGFWIFGFPNPVFWGFIMVILAFIPVLGTPIVWLPAAIIELSKGNNFGGIGMIIYGTLVISTIDNLLKPSLIGNRTGLHPMLVLLGIFGGLQFFGIIGMIIGPVVVAICMLIIKFFNQDVIFA